LDGKFPESLGADPNNIVPLLFKGGPIKSGDPAWMPAGIGIHERTFKDQFNLDGTGKGRSFLLIEQPIFQAAQPEPSSFVLMALGVATVGYAWRRRKSVIAA
jgi:hypothetical protein